MNLPSFASQRPRRSPILVPAAGRTNPERGAALILAFLCVMILVVVMGQLTVSSTVDRSVALNSLKDVQYEGAARGAMEIAISLLLRDAKDEQSQSEGAGADEGGGGGFGGFGGGGNADGGGGEEEAPTDTLLDLWADEGETTQQFGEGVEVRIRIIDEDRKLNLLTLVAEDEDYRDAFQDRLVRLLDTFREDSKHDLTYGDAQDIASGIKDWLSGHQRPKDVPRPAQSTDEKDESNKVYSEDRWTKGEGEKLEVIFPLTMDEFLNVDEVTEFILRGFIEDDTYVPGLEDVCTIYSNLVFDEERVTGADDEDEEEFKTPFGQDDDEEAGDNGDDTEPETDEDGGLVATETNHGRVNINTVSLPVLRCLLMNEQLSHSIVDKVHEFRTNAWDDDILNRAKSFQGHFGEDDDDKAKDEDSDSFGEDQKDFTFSSTDEVIDKVQDYFNGRFDVSEDAKSSLAGLIAVKSHVFTIMLEMRRTDGSTNAMDRNAEWVPPDRIYRAVVWRRASEEGANECLTLVPLHVWTGAVPPDTEDYRKKFPFGF